MRWLRLHIVIRRFSMMSEGVRRMVGWERERCLELRDDEDAGARCTMH
jgi:hypothetical protein